MKKREKMTRKAQKERWISSKLNEINQQRISWTERERERERLSNGWKETKNVTQEATTDEKLLNLMKRGYFWEEVNWEGTGKRQNDEDMKTKGKSKT